MNITFDTFTKINEGLIKDCKPGNNMELCKLGSGNFKQVYKYTNTVAGKKTVTVFTKQPQNEYSIENWNKLAEELNEEEKKYLLLPDKILDGDKNIYAQFTYCQSDLDGNFIQEQNLLTESRNSRGTLAQTITENFNKIEEVVKKLHLLEIDTLDIKPQNMLFKCLNKPLIVLTDLDGLGHAYTPDYTWYLLYPNQNQDLFALYVSILEIIHPRFFSNLGTTTQRFKSKHYLKGKYEWIQYCEDQIKNIPQQFRPLVRQTIDKLKIILPDDKSSKSKKTVLKFKF